MKGGKLKQFSASILCKSSRALLRLFRRGGTALPGKLALSLDPEILGRVSEGVETILVTGTNGKTTTCRILEHALRKAGREPLANRSGANLMSGITAEFVCCASVLGKARRRYAVIECDEAALRHAAPFLKPKAIVVTNLFRDQLDRYGEVMHTLEVIREAVREVPDTTLCLNADDSLAASLAGETRGRVLYFGLDPSCGDHGAAAVSDARRCIFCGAEYEYGYHTFAHLGGFRCPSCGYERPKADAAVVSIEKSAAEYSLVHMRAGKKIRSVTVGLPGLYNLYNAAAAVCAYTAAGYDPGEIMDLLGDRVGGFGRQETFVVYGRPVRMILVKNPAGCSQTLEYLGSVGEDYDLALGLNDRTADGHDISWIWDADYERLAADLRLRTVYVFGDRARDMCLRLRYADIPAEKIVPLENMKELPGRIRGGSRPLIILPNYTAMLALRAVLQKAAGTRDFWKG